MQALGREVGTIYTRSELKHLIGIHVENPEHQNESGLTREDHQMLSGVLDYRVGFHLPCCSAPFASFPMASLSSDPSAFLPSYEICLLGMSPCTYLSGTLGRKSLHAAQSQRVCLWQTDRLSGILIGCVVLAQDKRVKDVMTPMDKVATRSVGRCTPRMACF